MVRLKDPNQSVEERPKSRLGQLNPFSRSEQSFPSTKSEIKETLKRPLSSELICRKFEYANGFV